MPLMWTSAVSLALSVLIIVGGGVVRVTASGLGCPTWPKCDAASLTATQALGIHGAIEFTNRMLTGALCVAVVAVALVAILQRNRIPRRILAAAWVQIGLVVVNAIVGGITVLDKLNPWIVAGHFLAAIGLLTTTTMTWHWTSILAAKTRAPADPRARATTTWLLLATAVLVVLGTLVTGSGPHSGDSADVRRMPFNWTVITSLHGAAGIAVLTLALTLVYLTRLRPGAHGATSRAAWFLAIVLAQAVVGLVQSLTGLPSWVVVIHLLGAALVWVGAVRLKLDSTSSVRAQPAA